MQFIAEICSPTDPAREFVDWYADFIRMEINGQSLGCGFEDEPSGKLTLNVGKIIWNREGIRLGIDIRYPVTMQAESVINGIKKVLGDTKATITVTDEEAPIYFEENHFLIKNLLTVYRQETGDMQNDPVFMGGGTYARALKNAVAFGPEFPGEPTVAHIVDEHISIENLQKCTNIYAQAIYALSK